MEVEGKPPPSGPASASSTTFSVMAVAPAPAALAHASVAQAWTAAAPAGALGDAQCPCGRPASRASALFAATMSVAALCEQCSVGEHGRWMPSAPHTAALLSSAAASASASAPFSGAPFSGAPAPFTPAPAAHGDWEPRRSESRGEGRDAARDEERESIKKLCEELQCSICKELFVEASTIECGHSFCGPCIEAWLTRELSCPMCRHSVSKPPTRSRCLDKTVDILVQLAEEESKKTLQERKSRCVFKREKECAAQREMEASLAKAARAGVRVAHITKPWTEREMARFARGIEHNQVGLAREAFCGLVGLTHSWVGQATKEQLLIAARNVGVISDDAVRAFLGAAPGAPPPAEIQPGMCLGKLRSRVDMFISVG